VLCACGAPGSGKGKAEEAPAEVVRVSERVVVLQTLDVNVTAVRTGSGILIIDTGRSPTLMKRLLEKVGEELGRGDVRAVVNTHGHWDHTSGNQAFPEALRIGHESSPELMRQFPADSARSLWYEESRLADLRGGHAALEIGSLEERKSAMEIRAREALVGDLRGGYDVTPPSLTFSDRITYRVGELTLRLIHSGETHSISDIVAYIPEEGLLFTGDLFTSQSSFGFMVNRMVEIPKLLQALEEIRSAGEEVRVVIPGHGAPMSGEDLAALTRTLEERYAALEDRVSAARMLKQLMEEHDLVEALRRFEEGEGWEPAEAYLSEDEFDTLGYALLGKGQIDRALAVLRAAVGALPDSSLLHDSLGEAYLKRGEEEAAKSSYERSLALNPYNRNAEEMLEILRESR
jgi:cyclase